MVGVFIICWFNLETHNFTNSTLICKHFRKELSVYDWTDWLKCVVLFVAAEVLLLTDSTVWALDGCRLSGVDIKFCWRRCRFSTWAPLLPVYPSLCLWSSRSLTASADSISVAVPPKHGIPILFFLLRSRPREHNHAPFLVIWNVVLVISNWFNLVFCDWERCEKCIILIFNPWKYYTYVFIYVFK